MIPSEPAEARFPSTRYQGSKARLAGWIWDQIAELDFATCLDAFGGTGAVAYRLKQAGKSVTYNDRLRFNHYFGLALIENSQVRLSPGEIDWLLQRHAHIPYQTLVQDRFGGIYFTDPENAWIDQTIANLRQLEEPFKSALAFYALCQACLVKRPYNLFHRKNLYLRFAEVRRSFGNKATWDKPFEEWFRTFATEANRAVFDNGQDNHSLNADACAVPGEFDLVYMDPPYLARHGAPVDYRSFYHFLEGLSMYEAWEEQIDRASKHQRLKHQASEWADRHKIYAAFEHLFQRYQSSVLVISYRSDGIPSEGELAALLQKYKSSVRSIHFGRYQYVLSTNPKSEEILLIGK